MPAPGDGVDPRALVAAILDEFGDAAAQVRDAAGLEELQAAFLGRKRGKLTAVFQASGTKGSGGS